VETFSAYARQFLGGLERPDVDKIDWLSPGYCHRTKNQQ
jgi:excinuclease ABC subunit A